MNMVANVFGRRIAGERPGRARALLAAAATGFGAAAAVYSLLRSRKGTSETTQEKRG